MRSNRGVIEEQSRSNRGVIEEQFKICKLKSNKRWVFYNMIGAAKYIKTHVLDSGIRIATEKHFRTFWKMPKQFGL